MSKIDTSKTEWDLSPLLASDDDPKIKDYREAIAKATDNFVAKWRDRTDYLEKPEVLKEALDELEALETIKGNGFEQYYFSLKGSLDAIDPKIKAKDSLAEDFEKEIFNKMRFFQLALAKIKPDLQSEFLNFEPLAPFKHYLERTFAQGKYYLSEPEEKILILKSGVANQRWSQMTSDFLSRQKANVLTESGKKEIQTLEQILGLINSQQKPARDAAAKALNGILENLVDLAEVEFNAVLEDKKINDSLRGYERPDSSRHLADDIDTDVVDTLVKAVSERFEIPQRFYALKAKLLGLKKLEYHERNVEVGELNDKHPYDESAELVYEVFEKLDSEFAAIFKRFQESGQIDVFPKDGKRPGAFCAGNHSLIIPTYIMLNHNDRLSDVSTLAHELGHGINNELIKQKQNEFNCDTPTSTAEVASTFMEDFVLEHLMKKASDETRLMLMVAQIDRSVSSIFRQIAFYRFEQEIHASFREAGYLSKEEIGKIFSKHMESYMGDAVVQSPGSQNWWIYVPHFRYYFYVYSYAGGLSISKSLQAKVRQDPKFIDKVKEFLSAGSSKSPKDIFADMGIDITNKSFWNQGLDEIENLLNETEALAKKLGKI